MLNGDIATGLTCRDTSMMEVVNSKINVPGNDAAIKSVNNIQFDDDSNTCKENGDIVGCM